MRWVVWLLIMVLLASSAIATTGEVQAKSFWLEFDITFFQTFPFATLWGYFIDRQLSNLMFPGSSPHWQVILSFATAVSAGNAFYSAHQQLKNVDQRKP